eukprot:4542-Heterococcus_DN1.PRE.5
MGLTKFTAASHNLKTGSIVALPTPGCCLRDDDVRCQPAAICTVAVRHLAHCALRTIAYITCAQMQYATAL